MKNGNLRKTGDQHYVGYLSGVAVPYPAQNEFGCSVGVRFPRQTKPRSLMPVPKGNSGSRHDALRAPASRVTSLQMRDWDHDGSAISGMPAPLMRH